MRDAQWVMSDAQAITGSAASTNTIDLTDANHQIGQAAHSLRYRVQVAAAPAGSATSVDFALQDSADNSSFADTLLKLSSVAVAKLTAGTMVIDAPLPATGGAGQIGGELGDPPPGPSPLRRYVQTYYTLNGGAATGFEVNAWVEPY